MLRTPQNVSPDNHPDFIAFVEGNTFEEFLLNADDLCVRKDPRLMFWQNPNIAQIGQSVISNASQMFNIQRSKAHSFMAEREKIHFDSKIRPARHDPDKIFEGRILRVTEQLQGKSGTAFYHVDPEHAQFTDIHAALAPGKKSLALTPSSPYYDAFQGPFSLQPGQVALILSQAFGKLATPHGFAIRCSPDEMRETLLTDIEPLALRNG